MKTAKKLIFTIIIISICASMLAVPAAANNGTAYGAATVGVHALNVRSGPGTNHSRIALLTQGEVIVVLDRTNSEWFHINFNGTVGYVSAEHLREIRTSANFNVQGRVIGSADSNVNLRTGPGLSSDAVTGIRVGTELSVTGINNGWYRVQAGSSSGYIRSDLIEIIPEQIAQSNAPAPVTTNVPLVHAPAPVIDPNLDLGKQLVAYALNYVGFPYVHAGMSPTRGFDCSGFTSYIFRTFGMPITRNASGQYRDNGVPVPKSELAPGDLVFFSSNGRSVTHVGIYIGGSEFVHASTPRTGVIISRLDSSQRIATWHGARRVITN